VIAPHDGKDGQVALVCDGCRLPLHERTYPDQPDVIGIHGEVRAYHGPCAESAYQYVKDARVVGVQAFLHEMIESLGLKVSDL
jgi:hypothetical protein